MAKQYEVHQETVLLANSDDHLAAVEEAKRTGNPLESKGHSGSQIVPVEVAKQLLDNASLEDIYVDPTGRTYAASLEDWHKKSADAEYVHKTNEQKAREAEEAAQEYTKNVQRQEAETRAKMKDGFDVSLAIQQKNLERAQSATEEAAKYSTDVDKRKTNDIYGVIEDSVRILQSNDLVSASIDERANALRNATPNIPTSDERAISDELALKDRIVSTEVGYKEQVSQDVQQDLYGTPALEEASTPQELEHNAHEGAIAAGNLGSEAAKVSNPEERKDTE